MSTTYVTPDTVEHALSLLHLGLLYRNTSSRVPRDQLHWGIARCDDALIRRDIESAYSSKTARLSAKWHYTDRLSAKWHYTDFAYRVED